MLADDFSMLKTPERRPQHDERDVAATTGERKFVHSAVSPELSEQTRHEIEAILANPDAMIGEGGIGKVFRLPDGLCLKAMDARRLSPFAASMDLGNPPALEAALLQRLNEIVVDGVRSPRCYGFYEATAREERDGILMEELDAVNLQHAMNGDAPFPDGFDTDRFLDALTAYYDNLHNLGIAHNDIAPRNVMIDRATGLPRVIDFGRSVVLARVSSAAANAAITKDETDFEHEIILTLYNCPALTKRK